MFLFLLQKAWVVELWHYPVAMLFGVLGCGLALLGEIVGAVLQTLGCAWASLCVLACGVA